jgi:hypothetical protein
MKAGRPMLCLLPVGRADKIINTAIRVACLPAGTLKYANICVGRLCGIVVGVPDYRSRFDSRHYQIFWEVLGLDRGPLSLVSTTEELLERKSSCFGLENREYGLEDPLCWPHNTPYPQTLALTSPISSGLSVGIVRPRTEATEFVLREYLSSILMLLIQMLILPLSYVFFVWCTLPHS